MKKETLKTGMILTALSLLVSGCNTHRGHLAAPGFPAASEPGGLISAAAGTSVSFSDMMNDLAHVQVIYLGEQHSDPEHHRFQLRVIRELHRIDPEITIGMEMFPRSYRKILESWAAGELGEADFLRKTHWYASWKYDYALYRDILDFTREKRIRLIGLNVPFHIPPKIAVGGIENLSEEERRHLPKEMDFGIEAHRAYLAEVFKSHRVRGRNSFDDFYAAQVVWEEAMAEAVSEDLIGGKMVVLAGVGHIVQKFGIPERAYRRTGTPFRTICPALPESGPGSGYADYIVLTPHPEKHTRKTRVPSGFPVIR